MIADQHLDQLRYLPGIEVVGVCDREPLMARQLAGRFAVPQCFTDPAEMLGRLRPDAVHITTPVQSHFALGRLALEAGCHVYLEKPFTETVAEAEGLVRLAGEERRRITVGHNLQFSPEAVRMRQFVQAGCLGGAPVHLESFQAYSHEDPTYGKPVLSDPDHWVRRLPGSLLHNLISHGVAKLAEFLQGDCPTVRSLSFGSPFLTRRGETMLIDEVRATLQDEAGTTAFFLFTTQCRAGSNELRLYGPGGNLVLDNTYRTVRRMLPSRQKSYLRYFLSPWGEARESLANAAWSMRQFWRREFHMDHGMRQLMRAFYAAVREEGPDPIPTAEILRTSRIMDRIFAQFPGREMP